jgi:alpha-tubulin suppressor-like RCC1 family protein
MRYTLGTRAFSCAALLLFTLLNGCGGGSSTTTETTTPVSSVTVYYGHSAAFQNTSTVMTWGYNGSGQLGNGSTTMSAGPVNVLENGVKFRVPTGGLAIGAAHTLAFYNNSTVRAWGANFYGQLGNGSIANGVLNPVKVRNLSRVVAVAAGGNHSLALTSDSTVWSWGNNLTGQLGNNSIFSSYSAVQVQDIGAPLTGVKAIAAGAHHSLALKTDGTVWAWGYNQYGQLGGAYGSVSTVPMQVASLNSVKLIAAGGQFSVAVKDDNTVWVWGYNGFGQLGQNPETVPSSVVPLQVTGIPGTITAVTAGSDHILVLTQKVDSSWSVWGWGYNGLGQLGNSASNIEQLTPVQVGGLDNLFDMALTVDGLHPILAVGHHSLARTSAGLWAWGSNNYNQLGFVTSAFPFFLTAPKLVSGL